MIKVDIEQPYKEIETVPISIAIRRFDLDEYEILQIEKGKVVWRNDTALSLNKDENGGNS